MLISLSKLRSFWGINPTGVLHVGAHLGEELEGYFKNQFGPVTWIEAQPNLVQLLRGRVKYLTATSITPLKVFSLILSKLKTKSRKKII